MRTTKPTLRWSKDGTDVSYGQLRWRFTKMKARIFLAMAQARGTEFPEVPGFSLKELVQTDTDIRILFHRDPAWRKLIIPLYPFRRGFYRLATDQELWMLHPKSEETAEAETPQNQRLFA